MDDFDTTKIEDAKKNVKTYTEAEVLANTKTRNLYNESIEAVEAYNNALSEGKGIDKAKQNLDDIKQEIPLNKIGSTLDISKCVQWLIEDRYTTGQVISINGGWVII